MIPANGFDAFGALLIEHNTLPAALYVSIWDLLAVTLTDSYPGGISLLYEVCHERTDLRVFVIVIPKGGWVRMAAPILLLV